jgi:hypothetical protein
MVPDLVAKGVLQYPCHRKAAYDMKWENLMDRALDQEESREENRPPL